MTKPYDRNDNDTYVEKLSNNPCLDVEYHMFRHEKGHVIAGDGIRGNFTTESGVKAANNVLHFPRASDIKSGELVKITDRTLSTPYPLSLVQRYELNENNLTYSQKTPVFYDNKINKFVVLLDYRFARDIVISKEFNLDKKFVKLYYSKKEDFQYVGLLYTDMLEVNSGKSESLDFLMEQYIAYKMTLQQGEKVIVLRYKTTQNQETKLFRENNFIEDGLISTHSLNFEYAVAVRFGKRYYLCDADGNIQQKTAFNLDKVKDQMPPSTGTSLKDYHYKQDELAEVYVVAYTEEQYKIIDNLAKRMHMIHNELAELFRSSTDKNSTMDMPLLSLPEKSTFKLLDNK